ncbi:MAG: hypothetical protein FD139_3805 [Methylocystaceae bacterium]|nr:MAG: hypothetical protein FD139_3805 [Methylocystaceae bacterium]
MGFELLKKLVQCPRFYLELHIVTVDEGFEELDLKVARQRCDGTDSQHLPITETHTFKRAQQFLAGLEDRIGVVECDTTRFRQSQSAAVPLK